MFLTSFTFVLCLTSVAGMAVNETDVHVITTSETEKCSCNHDSTLYSRIEALEKSNQIMMEKFSADFPTNIDSRAVYSDVIGFTVALDNSLTDLPLGSTILYDGIRYNAGGAYDSSTGVFTCPHNGMYLFAIFVHATRIGANLIRLQINGDNKIFAISEPAIENHDSTGGNVLVHHLVKGDRVWVETYDTDNQDIYHGFTTFSGALIHSTST